MPAIFPKERVDAIYNAYIGGNYTRPELAEKFSTTPDIIDLYLLAGLKKFTSPAIAYKEKKAANRGPVTRELFMPKDESRSTAITKKFIRPKGEYSNKSTYGDRNFKSLLDSIK